MNNISTVTRIGAGERLNVSATADIVATLPEGFDADKRGAVVAAVLAWAVPAGEETPVQRRGPAGSQVATDFGRGVDALTKSVKRALSADKPKPVRLTVTRSGETEVTGSVVIPADHPLHDALVALIASASEEV